NSSAIDAIKINTDATHFTAGSNATSDAYITANNGGVQITGDELTLTGGTIIGSDAYLYSKGLMDIDLDADFFMDEVTGNAYVSVNGGNLDINAGNKIIQDGSNPYLKANQINLVAGNAIGA